MGKLSPAPYFALGQVQNSLALRAGLSRRISLAPSQGIPGITP